MLNDNVFDLSTKTGSVNAHAIKGPRQSGILSTVINNSNIMRYLLIVSLCHWLCTKVDLVLRVCDVKIFGQRAPYTISSKCMIITGAGTI